MLAITLCIQVGFVIGLQTQEGDEEMDAPKKYMFKTSVEIEDVDKVHNYLMTRINNTKADIGVDLDSEIHKVRATVKVELSDDKEIERQVSILSAIEDELVPYLELQELVEEASKMGVEMSRNVSEILQGQESAKVDQLADLKTKLQKAVLQMYHNKAEEIKVTPIELPSQYEPDDITEDGGTVEPSKRASEVEMV